MFCPYPHPISENKLIVFTRIEHERSCKSVILLEFFADMSQQRGYGRFAGAFSSQLSVFSVFSGHDRFGLLGLGKTLLG
jgi:hypothetical protein